LPFSCTNEQSSFNSDIHYQRCLIPMKSNLLFFFSLPALLLFSCTPVTETDSLFDRLGLEEIDIIQLQQGYENGDFTAQQVIQAYLERIEQIDRNGPALNAVLHIHPDALEMAAVLDEERQEGVIRGPLHGVPVLLKDNIDTADLPTTAGSRFMDGSIPPRDAFIVKKLREQGAIILGKVNLSEWANFHSSFSSSGWSGLGGQVQNPYALSRNPCGSSSGSGVAAAANLSTITIGTETNGSIVCPSGANGIVGLKPTVGLWSRSGIIPISYTTDSAGPMVRTVRDAAILLGALTGVDPDDDMTANSEEHIHADYTQFLNEDGLQGKRIGFYTAPLGNHFRVDTLMHQNIRILKDLGAEIVEIDQIEGENIGGDAFEVLLYEFRDGLNRYFESLGNNSPLQSIEHLAELTRNSPDESKPFDRNLILTAAEKGDLDSEEYLNALQRMQRFSREEGIDKVMDEHNLDAIVSPTGSPAWKTDLVMGDNFKLASSSPSARAGYPIISLPMGEIDGLPVGVSFFGRAWSEPVLLEIAYAFEQATQARFVPEFRN
jgi:amidase